jgi:hypothetical protein
VKVLDHCFFLQNLNTPCIQWCVVFVTFVVVHHTDLEHFSYLGRCRNCPSYCHSHISKVPTFQRLHILPSRLRGPVFRQMRKERHQLRPSGLQIHPDPLRKNSVVEVQGHPTIQPQMLMHFSTSWKNISHLVVTHGTRLEMSLSNGQRRMGDPVVRQNLLSSSLSRCVVYYWLMYYSF